VGAWSERSSCKKVVGWMLEQGKRTKASESMEMNALVAGPVGFGGSVVPDSAHA